MKLKKHQHLNYKCLPREILTNGRDISLGICENQNLTFKRVALNGYKYPRFTLTKESKVTDYDISFKYQALREYIADEEFIIITRQTGIKRVKFLWLRYSYELDFRTYSTDEDGLKVRDVLNGFYDNGTKVEVTPHMDLDSRKSEVILVPSKKLLESRGKGLRAYNQGLMIIFEDKNPRTKLDWSAVTDVAHRYRPSGRRSTRIV